MTASLYQIDPATALVRSATSYTTATTAFGQGTSVAGTLASQFIKQQGSLIYSRYSTSDRVFIHQGIQDRAQTLERAARTLFSRNYGESVFDQREVVVSSSSAVSGTAERLTSPFTFGIEVEQLAQAQKVVSDDLSDAGDSFTDGTEAFSLTVEGTTFSFSITVDASDTNYDVLGKIADEFNGANSSGIYAEVVSDSTTGESSLQLIAHSTGTDSEFTLSGSILSGINLEETVSVDTDAGTGGLQVSAQDAIYNLDSGFSVTSQTNTITLYDERIELVLSATTGGEAVTVSIEPNTSEIEEDLETFITAYNDALSFALALPSEATTTYALELAAAVSPFVISLESIGIERDGDGELSIDSDELAEALTDGRFARASALFIGPAGLATTTERVSRNLLDQGGKFLTQPDNLVERVSLLAINRYQNLGLLVNLIA
ncbi:MAG: flagellar filament capping protein FliD [Myxococcales bacterium]|nr:flagellar filament capping protein FliD [Myxococcales bacterium]